MTVSISTPRILAIGAVALAALAVASPAVAGALTRETRQVTVPTAPSGDASSSGIAVHGSGRVTVKPDMATVDVGVDAHAATAAPAQADASERMTAMIAALRKLGIAEADISTASISLNPVYDYGSNQPRLTGYQATQTLRVQVRDLTKLGDAIDAAVGAGGTQVNGISFSLADPSAATDQARKAAVEDAKRHASTLAAAAGVSVAAPIRISELGSTPPPPIMYERAMGAPAADKGSTPVSPGTLDVTVDVEVVFGIG